MGYCNYNILLHILLLNFYICNAIIPTSIKVNIGMFPLPNGNGINGKSVNSGNGGISSMGNGITTMGYNNNNNGGAISSMGNGVTTVGYNNNNNGGGISSRPMPIYSPSIPSQPSQPQPLTTCKFEMGPIMVKQVVTGNLHQLQQGASMTASVSLIHDNGYYMVVDTPSATDLPAKEQMLRGFNAANIFPGQVQMVLTTHGHPDHTGQANFFPNARHFFASYEYTGNNFIKTELYTQEEMKVTQNIELWNTPGHTNQDVSAIVRNTPCGTIAVVGDLFYSQEDAAGNSTTWRSDAWNPEVGDKYRAKVICTANCIVPGHGPVFSVTEEMRRNYNCSTTTTQPSPPPSTQTIPFTSITPSPTTPTTTTATPVTEPLPYDPNAGITMTLPPAVPTAPPPTMPPTTGYATVDYPTPPPYVDINGNTIDDAPVTPQQADTISPTTLTPPTTPLSYVTVDHWQNRPQSDPAQPPPQQPQYQPQPQQPYQPQPYVPAAPTPVQVPVQPVGLMPPCAMPCSVANGLYSVPAGVLPPYPQQLYQPAAPPPVPVSVPVQTQFIQHLPPFPLKNPFSQPGAVILPMVESAATNLVSYLNAPQMQPPAPQAPMQAGYFELIKRAFHKLTDHKPVGALLANKTGS